MNKGNSGSISVEQSAAPGVPAIARRSYDQHCPVACSLDLLGERWTLLIVRNLFVGPQRYTDLVGQLPGMASNLLATRLRDLEEHGIVRRTVLPPPAARTVYELTERGRDLEPVICALGRWGAPLLAAPGSRLEFQPHLLSLGLKTLLRIEALPPESLRFAVELDVGTWLVDILDRRDRDGRLRSLTERISVQPVDAVPDDVRALVRASAVALTHERADKIEVTGDAAASALVSALLDLQTA